MSYTVFVTLTLLISMFITIMYS